MLLAAYGRHGMASAELPDPVEHCGEYSVSWDWELVVMVVVRTLSAGMTDRMWSRANVGRNRSFAGTVGAESIVPDSIYLESSGMAAPFRAC